MSRAYDEATASRRARMSATAVRQQSTFEQAYGLAEQIIELRERHQLSQTDLAERTGIDQADISRIERGASNPTERTLLRIAEALGAELRLVEQV